MQRIIIVFFIFLASLHGDEVKYTRAFDSPPHLIRILKLKYEGDTLKELLTSAGANLDDADGVSGPNGAGIVVRSSIDN